MLGAAAAAASLTLPLLHSDRSRSFFILARTLLRSDIGGLHPKDLISKPVDALNAHPPLRSVSTDGEPLVTLLDLIAEDFLEAALGAVPAYFLNKVLV